ANYCALQHPTDFGSGLALAANVQHSQMGQKQIFAPQKAMSALPSKADICGATRDVRFGPKADMVRFYAKMTITSKMRTPPRITTNAAINRMAAYRSVLLGDFIFDNCLSTPS